MHQGGHHGKDHEPQGDAARDATKGGPSGGEDNQKGAGNHRRIEETAQESHRGLLFLDIHIDGSIDGLRALRRHPDIPHQHEPAAKVEGPAEGARVHHRLGGDDGVDEVRIGQDGVAFPGGAEHEPLGDAGDPHRSDIEEDADQPDPEMHVGRGGRVELAVPEPRRQVIEHPRRHEAVPAQGSAVDMADDPVRVMRQSIDRLDGQERPLKGGHAVKSHACREELENGVRAHFMPGAAEG